MSPQKPVLDQKHCDNCTQVLRTIPEIQELINKCKDCGLDTSEFQAQLDSQAAMAAAIKRNFFPHAT